MKHLFMYIICENQSLTIEDELDQINHPNRNKHRSSITLVHPQLNGECLELRKSQPKSSSTTQNRRKTSNSALLSFVSDRNHRENLLQRPSRSPRNCARIASSDSRNRQLRTRKKAVNQFGLNVLYGEATPLESNFGVWGRTNRID